MYWHEATETILKPLFTYERVGLISDMDGTLSPIVPRPEDAAPSSRNRDLLAALYEKLSLVAVVSGRSAMDVRERVDLPQLVYAGNHGLERWQDDGVQVAAAVRPYLDAVQAARHALQPDLPEGAWIEDKQATLSLHYRGAANTQQAAEMLLPIVQQVAEAQGLRWFQGRMIYELRPPLDMNKGSIFKELVEEYRLDAAIFVGDDTTDADALRMARRLREDGTCYSLAIGVESDDTPAVVLESSDVLVAGVTGVEDALEWLLDAATASAT